MRLVAVRGSHLDNITAVRRNLGNSGRPLLLHILDKVHQIRLRRVSYVRFGFPPPHTHSFFAQTQRHLREVGSSLLRAHMVEIFCV